MTQRILDRDRAVVAPVNYQGILRMEGTRGLLLEPCFWRQHLGATSSHRQHCCRALSRWRALPVLQVALLLPTRRQLLTGQVAADIMINLFVLDQVCLTNALLSNSSAPAGCRRAGRAQAGTKQLHIVCTQTNVLVCALSFRTKNQL